MIAQTKQAIYFLFNCLLFFEGVNKNLLEYFFICLDMTNTRAFDTFRISRKSLYKFNVFQEKEACL